MMEDTHIADGIAVTLLLACIVLTSGAVGTVGLAPTTVHVDGSSGDHTTALAFPIDTVTSSAGHWDVRITALRGVTDATGATSQFRMQDMDPYALPRRSDGLPQDMDPY